MSEAETRAERLANDLKAAQAYRVNWDSRWEKIARITLPTGAGYTTERSPGVEVYDEIYDSTAQLALPRFAAAMDTLVTPQTSRWHGLAPKNRALRQNQDVQTFCQWLTDTLFTARYAPKANFASRVYEGYMSLGVTGNCGVYVQDARPGLRYISLHMSEFWFDENHNGLIDKAWWVHEYTRERAEEKWGVDALPAYMLEEKDRRKKWKFCKTVEPNRGRDPSRRDNRNMPFASTIFVCDGGHGKDPHIVHESGYRTFPFGVARYVVSPRETYGRGAGELVFADNRTLQQMAKTGLRYGQLVTDPVWLAGDEEDLSPFKARAGHVNYGYLSSDGQARVQALQMSGNPNFTLEMMDQRRQSVNGGFLITLFQVLVENTSDRKTAYEVMQLVQEKGALLGPIGGRLRTEFLGTIIDRELDILFNAGLVRPQDVPRELAEDGGALDVEYDSPLTRAMRAEEGVGIARSLEFASSIASQIAAADQQRAAKFVRSINYEEAFRRVAEINGAPPTITFSDEQIAAMEEQQQQAASAQELLAAAPVLAETAKTLAQTQQISEQTAGIV